MSTLNLTKEDQKHPPWKDNWVISSLYKLNTTFWNLTWVKKCQKSPNSNRILMRCRNSGCYLNHNRETSKGFHKTIKTNNHPFNLWSRKYFNFKTTSIKVLLPLWILTLIILQHLRYKVLMILRIKNTEN